MTGARRWNDLGPRLATAAALAVPGGAAIAAGGAVFAGVAALACGVMAWEMARMAAPGRPAAAVALGLLAAACLLLARGRDPALSAALLALPAAAGAALPRARPALVAAGVLAVVAGGFALTLLRDEGGLPWLCWLVAVVVAADVAGYFGGKAIGGPKAWPAVSPGKTWAGILSGWAAAALVGLTFAAAAGAGAFLVWLSVLAAAASQAGDLAESAAKRSAGVKDSSSLLPGHGGLLDRFDGLLGASLLMLAATLAAGGIPGLWP